MIPISFIPSRWSIKYVVHRLAEQPGGHAGKRVVAFTLRTSPVNVIHGPAEVFHRHAR